MVWEMVPRGSILQILGDNSGAPSILRDSILQILAKNSGAGSILRVGAPSILWDSILQILAKTLEQEVYCECSRYFDVLHSSVGTDYKYIGGYCPYSQAEHDVHWAYLRTETYCDRGDLFLRVLIGEALHPSPKKKRFDINGRSTR